MTNLLEGLVVKPPDARGLCRTRVTTDPLWTQTGLYNLGMLQLLPGVEAVTTESLDVPANIAWPTANTMQSPQRFGGLQLRTYQCEALALVETSPLGALVALDVGLGKTPISCAYLARHPDLRPFLVISPLIGAGAWMGEDADPFKHFGLTMSMLRSVSPSHEKIERGVDGYFINYDTLPNWVPWVLLQLNPEVVIVDESHEIRNIRAKQSKAVHTICQSRTVSKRILLTATPVVNNVMDLYHQLDCAQPNLWGKYCKYNAKMRVSFGDRYGGEFRDTYGIRFAGETNVGELRGRLANVMIRRSRIDVRTELPPMTRQAVVVPPDQLDPTAFGKYKTAAMGITSLLKLAAADQLKRGTEMLGQLSWSKRDIAVSTAASLLATRRKLVVFSWYRKVAGHVAKQLGKLGGCRVFGPVDGAMKIDKRLEQAEAFKALDLADGQSAAFVATLGAAGMSLNPLSCASAALFIDLYWVPATLLQAEGRIHREGQRAGDVLIQYLIVRGSSDDLIWRKLERKSKSIASTTGDKGGTTLVEELGGKDEGASMTGLLRAMDGIEQMDFELT